MPKEILVVDDDESMRNLIGRVLADAGYSVHFAENGLEGLKAVDAGGFSLVISDLMMPEVDGLMFAEGLRNFGGTKELPIIFVTASEDPRHFADSLKYHAKHFINKPFSIDKLVAKVRDVIGPA